MLSPSLLSNALSAVQTVAHLFSIIIPGVQTRHSGTQVEYAYNALF